VSGWSTSTRNWTSKNDGIGSCRTTRKQSLAFARVFLQKPNWVVANDALDILNPTSRKRIREIMQGALSHIGLINVGHDVPESGVYHYKVRLVRDPHGPAFEGDRAPQTSDQPMPAAEQSSGG
jgi:putative ATP-binding cassette transporter